MRNIGSFCWRGLGRACYFQGLALELQKRAKPGDLTEEGADMAAAATNDGVGGLDVQDSRPGFSRARRPPKVPDIEMREFW